MLAADVAKCRLSSLAYNAAKPAFQKVRATLIRRETKTSVLGQAFADRITERALRFSVFFKRPRIHGDLPANAAAIAAFVCRTLEIFCVFW